MLDEDEFDIIRRTNYDCVRTVKDYRKEHGTSLADTLLEELYAPVGQKYAEMTGAEGYSADAIMYHRISLYGRPCSVCGKPLRSPKASRCLACGARQTTGA